MADDFHTHIETCSRCRDRVFDLCETGESLLRGTATRRASENLDHLECPSCGQRTLQSGYGLLGGGIGTYLFCAADGCDHFDKTQDKAADE